MVYLGTVGLVILSVIHVKPLVQIVQLVKQGLMTLEIMISQHVPVKMGTMMMVLLYVKNVVTNVRPVIHHLQIVSFVLNLIEYFHRFVYANLVIMILVFLFVTYVITNAKLVYLIQIIVLLVVFWQMVQEMLLHLAIVFRGIMKLGLLNVVNVICSVVHV